MPSVSIVGIGRAGGALAVALSGAGYKIDHLIHRDPVTAEQIRTLIPEATLFASSGSLPSIASDLIIIATPDPDIRTAAEQLSDHLQRNTVVLHTSGSLSSDILSTLAEKGCATGSMHPLVSISDAVSGARTFAAAYFCIEGDKVAAMAATSIVEALGGRAFSIETRFKPLYHAAAVMSSGHFVALIDAAVEMLARCGIESKAAKAILLPLIRSTLNNLEAKDPAQALTGSFARADADAIGRHLSSFDDEMQSIREIYLLLGERSIDLAAANGADSSAVEKLRENIAIAKRKPE
ncbi:MAG: DUF2520 domain-containing protein [Blastocatellia bacterium]|nr:DUF2520 domain-containing protein [Blastocatellia bacterium]